MSLLTSAATNAEHSALLGRHEVGRAENLAGHGKAVGSPQAAHETEVRDAGLVVGVHEDVRWLEVAVERVLAVGIVEGLGDGEGVPRGELRVERSIPDQLREVRP